MPNDTNTLNGALQELGETMADNLVSMGVVDASASDGLTTLAGRILDIEPSIGGLDLDTAVTISSSESSISLGSSIVLTSKLTASYDDETIVDVDLSGVLQNATLIFKNGNTTIGTAVTDVNGVATFTYTPPAIGTLSLKTIFAGTDNFNNCESSFINVTVVAPSYDGVVVSSDKDILSYYDSDSCTLSAQLMDGTSTASVSGVTVEFFNGSVSLGTAETNNSGVATLSYDSQGIGDMSITASVGIISSETYTLIDAIKTFFRDTDTFSKNPIRDYANSYSITDGVFSVTSRAGGGLVSDSTFQCDTDWECTYEVYVKYEDSMRVGIHSTSTISSNTEGSCFGLRDYNNYVSIDSNTGATGSVTLLNRSYRTNTWHTIRLVAEGTTLSIYCDDNLVNSKSGYNWLNDELCLYSQSWNTNGNIQMKNFIFKPL